jgi:hypothetical protein
MDASRKVEGGKFVRLSLSEDAATLTGDFFLYPEDAITDVEATIGAHADDPAAVEAALDDLFGEDVTLLGASAADIAALVTDVNREGSDD